MWSGAIFIVIGVLLVVTQLAFEMQTRQFVGGPVMRGGKFDPTSGIDVKTSYVGVMVLGIGAILEIIGYLAGRPWRRDQEGKISN
jgi:hypothetical protein